MFPLLLISILVTAAVDGHATRSNMARIWIPWGHQRVAQHESACKTPSGEVGRCVNIYQCKSLLALLNTPYRTPQDYNILKWSHCGFQQKLPKVCCPEPRPRPTSDSKKCSTPDGQEGQCISIYSCPSINSLLQRPMDSKIRAYIQNSRCHLHGSDKDSVCCVTSSTTMAPVTRPEVCTPTAMPPDPRTECCGLDGGNSNRIVGGNETAIDQYPWLVIIEYMDGMRVKLLCGGALISGRYVLTAAHCVTGSVLKSGIPTNVRLGEYDISNSGPDCQVVEGGGEDCTTGALAVPIEDTTPHPRYDPDSQLRRNDIALIRLKELAPHTDFIRPICLPTIDVTASMGPETRLYSAGWGAVDSFTTSSNTKMHVDLPYKTLSECRAVYNRPQFRVPLWEGQICAGGEQGKDSCRGDSGGPLMYASDRTYEIVGIVSFGPKPCGLPGVPGVYTKVYEYLPWIRSQIRP